MKIVIAIDKFKGCATSKQLSQVIAEEIENHLPSAQIVTVPIADGGDGTLHAIKEITTFIGMLSDYYIKDKTEGLVFEDD